MSQPCERKVLIDVWTILKVIGILAVIWLLYLLRDILALIFAAVFLAALMNPAARFFAKYKIPKGITVVCIYLLMLGVTALVAFLLLPVILEETSSLLDYFGISWQTLGDLKQTIGQLSTEYGLTENIKQLMSTSQLAKAAGGFFSTISSIFGGIVGLILVLVMAFYAVVEEREAQELFKNLVPEKYQDVWITILKHVEEKISHWLIGQLALGLIIGILYYIGLSLIGVKSALVLAIFGGFMEFIPYIGPILVSIPVVVIAFSQSPITALLAIVIQFGIQQMENHFIVPKVMQKAVGLNPLVSIIALLVGAELFGIVGMLLAIPVATAMSVIISELYRHNKTKK
ncbi:MAG: AI-2E family transporter [Patescibacteria group bacterium]